MIEINVVRDKQGFIWEFTVKGHARFSKAGTDIVCAAVSTLAQTALGALEDFVGIKNYSIKHGFIKCVIPSDISEDNKYQTKIILETIILGFKQIQLSYKKYLSVLDEEV